MEITKTRKLKVLTLFVAVLFSLISFGQKEGTYLTPDDPLCTNWEFIDDAGNAPILAGVKQNFISIVSGLTRSSMGYSKWKNNVGFECPTYFNLSRDENYFYFQLLDEPCNENLSEEDKFFKVEYNIGMVKKVNTIEINGSKHEIEEMKTILTLTIDGENYHFTIVEE